MDNLLDELTVDDDKIRVLVLVGANAEISPELATALEAVRAAIVGDDDDVVGHTVFRVNVDRDEAVVVRKPQSDPWAGYAGWK